MATIGADSDLDYQMEKSFGTLLGAAITPGGALDLRCLAEAAVVALMDCGAVSAAAFSVHAEMGMLLDPTWDSLAANTACRRSREKRLVWQNCPEFWAALESQGAGPDGDLSAGVFIIEHPACSLFEGGRAAPAGPCLVARAADAGILAVEVGPAADAAESLVALRALGQVLEPLVSMGAEMGRLRGRLRTLDGENKTLARLNRLQGRFVALASHEFKAPLTSITAYTDVLSEQMSGDEFPHAGEFLGVIRTETDRLLRMVHRILDFTRLEFGGQLLSLEPVEMVPLVNEAVLTLQPRITAKNLIVEVQTKGRLPRAVIDADLIRQVIMNLVDNAVKFTPKNGRVTVVMQETESSLAVSVLDDGPGIPPEDIRRIFREFYRAEGQPVGPDGSGLGLTIARHIIHLHGGHIEVARRPEGGSDFRFMVPKETGALASVAEVLRLPVDPEKSHRLVEMVLYLLADMTGSRSVMLMLRDGQGALVPVGAIGLEDADGPLRPLLENEGWTRFLATGRAVTDPGGIVGDLAWCPRKDALAGTRMFAPIGSGEDALGCVILGRRRGVETYGRSDLGQLDVLNRVVARALGGLEGDLDGFLEAVNLLLLARRRGIPSATAAALDLVGKLAGRLGFDSRNTDRLLDAALLHDAGMARVEDEIVLGETGLSWDERDEVDRHVERGLDLLGPLVPDEGTRLFIRHHHEEMDGSGYPGGLRDDGIPLGSRILAVVDAWCALTSGRPFRLGLGPAEAVQEIRRQAGNQFDPAVVTALEDLLEEEGTVLARSAHPVRSGPDSEETQ